MIVLRVLLLLTMAGLGLLVAMRGDPRTAPATAGKTATVPAGVAAKSFYATRYERQPSAAELTGLGRRLFGESALSASGRQACASCHDPARAYGPADARPVALGGLAMDQPGLRAVPSLRYAHNVPPFSEHHFDEAVDESVDAGPTGGRDWDGRADSAHDQARAPLLSPFEMGNADEVQVVERLRASASAPAFREVFGEHVFDDRVTAFNGLLWALEVFQQSPKDFYPFDSRFDAWLRGKGSLSPQELRGFAAFNDERKGNCASCHPGQLRWGAFPQFTDFGYVAVGVPRNREIPANADPAYVDLGLCGPLREDLRARDAFCGFFRAPSLRNTAARRTWFHNGAFHDLRRVVEFYATRDTDPARWYPKAADGSVEIFDDLPPQYRNNVNHEPPFDRKPGDASALTNREIDDIVAFLQTLDDADVAAARSAVATTAKSRRP